MLLIALTSLALAAPPDKALPRTVVLVRHAEKGAGDNPSLTEAGLARARDLARLLRSVPLDAVYSTDLCRTAQTVDPAALARGLPLQLLPLSGAELSGCSPVLGSPVERLPATDDVQADLVARIEALPAGSQVLVAGHSNTVPALVEALGAPSLCPELLPLDEEGRCWLGHDDYDDVFVLTLPRRGPSSVLRLHPGP